MVHFVTGRAGSGKSTRLFEQVKAAAEQGKTSFLFVPEQFTFETERKYYAALGAKIFRSVRVLSFTRLAHNLFKEYGGVCGDYADDSMKLILMNMALHEVKDSLQVYGRALENVQFSKNMVELVGELKNADCEFDEFEQKLGRLPEGMLKLKSRDVSLIYDTYSALLSGAYKDALDDLSRAAKLVEQHRIFDGCTVFIDEFKGFTARELMLIRLMMKQADDLTVTLCTDGAPGENSLFSCVNDTYQDLKHMAQTDHVRIAAPERLEGTKRFASPELVHLEQHLLSGHYPLFLGKNQGVRAVLAENEYDEADYVLATIRTLVESGEYRCRDIVLLSRDLESYRACLQTSFEKYKMPYYLDELKPVGANPLIRLTQLALELASGHFSTDGLLSMLKCSLTPFSLTSISKLENYAYLWDLKRRDWEKDFTFSIFGLNQPRNDAQKHEQEETLAELNGIRGRTMTALEHLHSGLCGSAKNMSAALLAFLEELGVRETLNEKLGSLREEYADEMILADEYRKVWEILGQIADILARTIGNCPVTAARYTELFKLVSANFDLGTIPQTLDSVTVGSAERVRTNCPKVVFVLGANDGIFPFLPDSAGVFTDDERRTLMETLELPLSRPLKERIKEERFIAYKTLVTPSEQLYLTARKADVKGTTLAPSYLFAQFQKLFGEDCVLDTADLSPLYFCKTEHSAFSMLAYQFRQDNELTASLKEYFSHDPEYSARMESIAQNLGKRRYTLQNPALTKELFGREVQLSPSRVEQFYKCKFRYFCEYGLGLKKREKIQLNAVNKGTIVHDVLYHVCTQIQDFSVFDKEKIAALVRQAVDETVERMGGYDRQSKRFVYLYDRVQKSVLLLLRRLFEELHHSLFLPCDFEYRIGDTGNVKAYTLTTKEGVTLRLQGTVDRIDAYEDAQGRKFVRVIDYKTGTKEFKLSDLLNGLNLQMFLYLLCLERSDVGKYAQIQGAGALYMPAGDLTGQLARHAQESEREQIAAKHYRMRGVVLDEEPVVRAMEPELSGTYTPISVKAKAYDKTHQLRQDVFVERHANEELFDSGTLESLLTKEQLGKLFGVVERAVGEMAEELYSGNIEAKPLVGDQINSCDYCSFKATCGFEERDPVRDYISLKKKELFDYLDQQDQAGEEKTACPQ